MNIRKWGITTLKDASERLLEALDRADERGGELRDQIKEKVLTSRRITALKNGLMKRPTLSSTDNPTAAGAAPAAAAPTAGAQTVPSSAPTSHAAEVFSYGDARKPAQVFGARSCPWSGRSLRLFESAGINAVYVDLDLAGSGSIREELRAQTGQQTIPYIYLRGRFIGGFNALDEIYRLGQLPYYLLSEAERQLHPDHGKIDIAPRASKIDAFDRPPS